MGVVSTLRIGRMLRRSSVTWKYGLNLRPTVTYLMARPALSSELARVVAALDRDGIAITTADALLGADSAFGALSAEVESLETARAADLAAARLSVDAPSEVGRKTFNVELLGSSPVLDLSSVYARFALQRQILGVANAYFGMYTRLRYYNVWHTLASQSQARESQLWHRDREDFQIMKVFAYLSDVGPEAGPFTYAPGTHPKGTVRREPEYTLEAHVRRSTDDQMAAVVPDARWIEASGPRGTIVFADTRGQHKGGLARGRDRLMYTCMFTSQASASRELFDRRQPLHRADDPAIAFALG